MQWVDFAAGAVEVVMRFGNNYDLLQIEGQGHCCTQAQPQPCHYCVARTHRSDTSTPAGQTHIRNHPHVAIPPLPKVIQLYETVASAAGAFAPVTGGSHLTPLI